MPRIAPRRYLLDASRRVYRLLPRAWRESSGWTRRLPHDVLYTANYFAGLEESAAPSAPIIARTLVETFHPRRVIDVGCGSGNVLLALRALGCEVVGLEYAQAAIARCRARGLDVRSFDLEKDNWEHESLEFDVAVSLEVAEHLPAALADRYVGLLSALAPTIVFTAAYPGQGGRDHVNEQPPSYWIQKFAAHGFVENDRVAAAWRQAWQESNQVAPWYVSNLMLFQKLQGNSSSLATGL